MPRLTRLPRWLSWPVLTLPVPTAVALTYPGGPAAAFEDASRSRESAEAAEKCSVERGELDAELLTVRERLVRKEQLVGLWCDGRIDFRELVADFAALNRGLEVQQGCLRLAYGEDLGADEINAINAVVFLNRRFHVEGSGYRHGARLRAEYRALYGRVPPATPLA